MIRCSLFSASERGRMPVRQSFAVEMVVMGDVVNKIALNSPRSTPPASSDRRGQL
jgi:hypothetical protein